jgi:hypothetical protein
MTTSENVASLCGECGELVLAHHMDRGRRARDLLPILDGSGEEFR